MKREIKFKAWFKKEKHFFKNTNKSIIEADLGEIASWGEFHPALDWDNIEFLQFTGMTDRYDNEIFEGDILDFDRKHMGDKAVIKGQYIYAVKWCEMQWEMRYAPMQVPLFASNAKASVVIGNIYKDLDLTKELIKKHLERLSNVQILDNQQIDQLFKLKVFNPQDKSMDEGIENGINRQYQYDEDYLAALHEEFEDFSQLIDQVWAEKDILNDVSEKTVEDVLAEESKI